MSDKLFLIYARASNGVIGNEGRLPWHIPADLKRFKALTIGKPMIMGRKTFDSLPGLLPERRHIVLTRDREWQADGAEIAHSIGEALELAGDGEVAVIGGSEIYDLFMPLATRIELTDIHQDYDGDAYMPLLPAKEWEVIAREDHPAQDGRPSYSFVTLERANDT